MEKEIQVLSKVTVNHLFLAQFEAFRASVLSLRKRNPSLALAILQTVVAQGGRFNGVLWSGNCSSPSSLAWLSALILLELDDASSIWNLDPELFKLKVEFLLLMQLVSSRVSENVRKLVDLESIDKEDVSVSSENFEYKPEDFVNLKESNGDLVDCLSILDRISDLGLRRLREEIVESCVEAIDEVEDGDLKCLTRFFLDQAEIIDALCLNIQKQVRLTEQFDSGLAITVHNEEKVAGSPSLSRKDSEALNLLRKNVQMSHLDALKELVKEDDVDGAISHLRFLHQDYGVTEFDYQAALQGLTKKIWMGRNGFGSTWRMIREKMLLIYAEALSSNCTQLVHMIQVIQDGILSEEIEMYRASDANWIPPLDRLQKHIMECGHAEKLDMRTSYQGGTISFCMRDMYHYARISGVHILECVIDTALSAIKREQLQEASNVLSLYPLLQPLVAVMGWDLLAGKTIARKNLMQLLWTSKSQVLRLEEFNFYGKQSGEISCVEHLCDVLCYHLDLSSFVASVNSGQQWNSKSSLLLSGKEQKANENQDAPSDPFVENLVLERLAVQTPLRVLFDVVPGIKFQDAIELISMLPIASTASAWKRILNLCTCDMLWNLLFLP